MMPNVLQYPVAVAAVLRAGFIAVNVNPLYTARELEHQLNDSGAEAIIILENFATTLQRVMGHTGIKHVVVASMGDLLGFPKGLIVNFVVRTMRKMVPAWSLPGHVKFNDALRAGRSMVLAKPQLGPDDVAVLQYTGGTTGVSKGATLLHRTLVANLLASEAWMQPGLNRRKITGQLTIACALPLYHVFAFVTCGLLGLRTGALNVLIPNPRDLAGTIKYLAKYRINVFPAVNTLFNGLANNPAFARLDFSELVISNGGGMAVQEAVAKKWLAITGCPICEGYGLSETSAGVTCNPTDSETYTGTIGLPLPNVEIRILDDSGRDVPIGKAGEIAIRGPQVMRDYWQQPEETAKVMTADGFFKSGDIGIMDARGYTRIVDRKKDMILVSGFNVYPNEVEAVVAAHPGVLECAAVGVPDANSGEAVMLFVVKKDPSLTREALDAYCHQELTGYKRPKYIEFRAELPKSNVGKILRRELRDGVVKKAA
jgi:long-chain acyl-CoA synthetase